MISTVHGFLDYRRKNSLNQGNEYGRIWIEINGGYIDQVDFENVKMQNPC
jgi:hypothetical protein